MYTCGSGGGLNQLLLHDFPKNQLQRICQSRQYQSFMELFHLPCSGGSKDMSTLTCHKRLTHSIDS